MCLSRLEKFPVKSNFGWKCFWKNGNGGLIGPFNAYKFPVNTWLNAGHPLPRKSTHLDAQETYQAGFHIYATRDDARRSGNGYIRRVKFRDVIATGYEGEEKVIVAQEILVLPIKKRSKK